MEEAKKILLSFFEEMNILDDETYEKIQKEEEINLETRKIQESKLREIFSKYCVSSNIEERGIVCSYPAEYSVETQQIYNCETLTKNKVLIYTEKIIYEVKFNYRYILVRKNDKWLIDKKQVSYDDGEKWEKSIL